MSTEPILSLHVLDNGGAPVVRTCGDLDMSTAHLLTEAVDFLVVTQAPPLLILDLARLSFFSAAGVTALLRVRATLHAHRGRLVLSDPPALTRHILAVTGVRDLFDIRHTANSAGNTRPNTGVRPE